ncbi:MAG: hypothetical protein WCA90_07785, partial [Ilumatobacteraceae bacterium]
AQLCGVPLVAYEATGTVDAVAAGVGGVLVPVGGVGELASALGELVADRERRPAMGAAGSAWVAERFDRAALWTGLVERYRSWSASAGSG